MVQVKIMKQRIEQKLAESLDIQHLEVIDDSASHVGHAGARVGGESHFNIIITSPDFAGKSKVIRHKLIYAALKEELEEQIHALSIKAFAPDEA